MHGCGSFFTEFGLNMTMFVMPSGIYLIVLRATGHEISADICSDRSGGAGAAGQRCDQRPGSQQRSADGHGQSSGRGAA